VKLPLVTPPNVPSEQAERSLEDPNFIRLASEYIAGLPEWIAPIILRMQQLHTMPGSRFEDDDLLKPTDPPSAQVINLLRSGLDHLQALSDAVGSTGVRPLAGFTLVRSTIEASALAAWLMLPATKDVRLKHSIQLSVENRRDTETYTKRFELGDTVSKWFRKEMTATKDQRPGTKNMDLDKGLPPLTSIIQTVDKHQKFSGLTGLDAWRIGSGIAHSNSSFAGGSLSREELADQIKVTGRPTTFMMILQPGQQYLEYSLAMAERYMAPTPGKG
jgi:hypothetical protein